MNIARLEKDGVNVNGIAMLQKATTGSAFVSYRSQAQRDFIFNMPNSACGLLTADHIDEALLISVSIFILWVIAILVPYYRCDA
ncbi:fructokinase [Klebsiella pneumoniae]|uniref:Fructokinase n=1 Tax=Klebsiella pneumoniae TaxID=573 RepID=A0A378A4J5_KLEPN|nr:fructokinase [Klebsiella pneumoniae]